MQLDEESQKILTINTHKKNNKNNCTSTTVFLLELPLYQKVMQILQGISNVTVYLDDLQVTGKTQAEHVSTLGQVMSRLEEYGLRLQKEKCPFMKPEVDYLGHKIGKNGLHPLKDKVQAINDAPATDQHHRIMVIPRHAM
nr:hypothetical protein BaRGS_007202 [Batillaria attramentaria]